MVQVTITYSIEAYNTGVLHDLICGCSLLDPNTGTELYALPWWVCWGIDTGYGYIITLAATGDIAAGTYQAKARAWENYDLSGSTKYGDLDSIGSFYSGGTLTGILDEAVQTLVIGVAGVSADITNFTITI